MGWFTQTHPMMSIDGLQQEIGIQSQDEFATPRYARPGHELDRRAACKPELLGDFEMPHAKVMAAALAASAEGLGQ